MNNQYGEQMVALNIERINHWLGSGAHLSIPAAQLLGIAGLLPTHPRTILEAVRNRKLTAEGVAEEK